MKGGKTPLGYTIVEVMVVLAVSGIMFLIAATFINGKQEKASFTEGVNDMASTLQNIVTQVESGQYSDINLNTCTFTTASKTVTFGPLAGSGQGTNQDCVFLGKLVYFSYDAPAPQSANYEVFSMAGGRVDGGGNPITTPSDAGATVIDSLTSQQTVPQNLLIRNVTVIDTSVSPLPQASYGIGFLQSPSVDVANSLTNGASNVGLYYVPGLGPNHAVNVNTIINSGGGANVKTAQRVDICLSDGTQYAEVTLGTNNAGNSQSNLNVDVKMDGKTWPGPVVC
jgi:prepilin-type N-terminal cleavage/methylation domain-containing protein